MKAAGDRARFLTDRAATVQFDLSPVVASSSSAYALRKVSASRKRED